MKKLAGVMALALILSTGSAMANPVVREGRLLYLSPKFKCFQCHGPTGAEGGRGPSFRGIGVRLKKPQILERAAHRCPPTGMCNPKELNAIVEYLMTL